MQVVGNHFRLNAEQPFQVCEGLLKEFQRFLVFQVSDVLAHDGMAVASEAKRILKFRAAGENLNQRHSQIDHCRDVPTRPPQNALFAMNDTHDRIVLAHVDAAVVQE